MSTPAVLLYAPDGNQYQRYGGVRGSGLQLSRTAAVAGDGPNAWGTDGLQKYPFGTQMILQDGRKFRFTVAGGTLIVIGNTQQSSAPIAGNVNQTAVASALGSRTPQVTVGATSTTADQYAGGYAVVSVTPDGSNVYFINDHAAATNGTVQTLNLASGHAIRTSAWTTTSRVDFIKNPYDSIIIMPTTASGTVVGVAVTPLAAYLTTGQALSFGWVQTRGIAGVLTNGTVVIGEGVFTGITTAGAVTAVSTTYDEPYSIQVGFVARVAATTAFSSIFLTLDG